MFGGHALGGPWGLRGENGGEPPLLLQDAAWRQTHRQLTECYRQRWEWFGTGTDASPVGMLYNFESLLADESAYRRAYEAMAQTLMQHQIPFRYLLSDRLEQLNAVNVLILPHVLPLADETEATIRAWVGRGGKLLATGRCGLYDGWMRQRADYTLADLFGVRFSDAFEDTHHDAVIRNPETGCVLLPGQWGQMLAEHQPACRIPADRVAREVRAMLPADVPEIVSPVPQLGCALRRLSDGSRQLGLLKYGDEPVRGIEVMLTSARMPVVCGWDSDRSDTVPLTALPVCLGRWRVPLPAVDVEYFLMFQALKATR
jgi:hypothetical protein